MKTSDQNSNVPTRKRSDGEIPVERIGNIETVLQKSDDYRTVGGIARECGLSIDQVQVVLNNFSNKFETAPYQIAGKTLYTVKDSKVCTPV